MEKMLFYFFPSYFSIRDHSFYALRYSNPTTKFFQKFLLLLISTLLPSETMIHSIRKLPFPDYN